MKGRSVFKPGLLSWRLLFFYVTKKHLISPTTNLKSFKSFSLGGGGTDGTTQSLPWIECASSRSTPGSCDKQILNDQFKEIFYRWKFLWRFRKHQCCYCCCCCCHVFLPHIFWFVVNAWKDDFCKKKWNSQKISFFQMTFVGATWNLCVDPKTGFLSLENIFLAFLKKMSSLMKILLFSLDFSNSKYFHLNDSPEAILSSGIYTAL